MTRRLGALLPEKYRREVFEPVCSDWRMAHLKARKAGRGSRRFGLVFGSGLVLLFLHCLWISLRQESASRKGSAKMRWILQDIRLSGRGLMRNPGFALAVVAVLALGIGANSAIFTFLDQVVFRPLPFPDPSRVLMLSTFNPRQGSEREEVSIPDLIDWRERNRSFSSLVGYTAWGLVLSGDHEPEDIATVATQAGLFEALGVSPLHGRTILESDEPTRAVILSHRLWQRRFNGDPSVVGRTARMDGQPYLVLGVMKPDFAFPTPAVEAWVPLHVEAREQSRRSRWIQVIGRLKEGATLEQARQEFNALAAALGQEHPDTNKDWQIALEPLPQVVAAQARSALWMLQGAVILVLLIACVNAGALLLARCHLRRREIAIRRALGAGRARIFLSALTENFLLCLGGAALGVAAAALGVRVLASMMPATLQSYDFYKASAAAFPLLKQAGLDWRAVVLALGLSLATAAALALLASGFTRGAWSQRLREGGGTDVGHRSHRARRLLVALQVALALLPLAGAALLSRKFVEQLQVDPGFEVDNLLTFEVGMGHLEKASDRAAFVRRVRDEVASIAGVEAAGYTTVLPFTGVDWRAGFHILDRDPAAQDTDPTALVHRLHPEYFRALGIALQRGRLFDSRDHSASPLVALINEAAARRYWGNDDPLGEKIYFRSPQQSLQIIGVMASIRSSGLSHEPVPEIYLLFDQSPAHYFRMAVRTPLGPGQVMPAVKERIWAEDAELPVTEVSSMQEILDRTMAPQRFTLTIMGLFAAAALLLSATGTYAAIAYLVAQRRREMSVRMALGAGRGQLMSLVIRTGMRPALAGSALGLVGAAALWTFLERVMGGFSLADLTALAAAVLLLLAAALCACWLPARRASSVDPASVIRSS
ncbi:MAG TPA: ADOP family duplicated permease [Acidobacteriota bacterium]|nr:ADOP family duplicated permease [Acidobacteriota bacterium]